MSNFSQTLSKDKPLYALTVGEFELLMSELMPSNPVLQNINIEPELISDQMTIKECAKYLKVSESTLHRYKNNKVIPFYKAGRTVYFKRSEVDASLSSEQKKKGNKI